MKFIRSVLFVIVVAIMLIIAYTFYVGSSIGLMGLDEFNFTNGWVILGLNVLIGVMYRLSIMYLEALMMLVAMLIIPKRKFWDIPKLPFEFVAAQIFNGIFVIGLIVLAWVAYSRSSDIAIVSPITTNILTIYIGITFFADIDAFMKEYKKECYLS